MPFTLTLDKGAQILFAGGVSWFLGGLLGFLGLMNGWLAFITAWIVAILLHVAFAIQKVGSEGKAVLVTGCDTGFGYGLALRLDELGFRVFAGCLMAETGEGAKSLKEKGSGKLHVIQLNVTSERDLETARARVEELLPKDECLWGVVNNAGLSTFGNMDWVPVSTYKKMADVNVFGTISVTKTFLPLLRRGNGRLVNVASILGRFGAPIRSPYVATKYAVEGISECLRQELKPSGVEVIVIEPGNYIAGTALFTPEVVERQGNEMWASMSEETRDFYGESFKNQINLMKSYVSVGDTNITPVITAFEEALTQKYPQARYQPADLYYKTRIFVSTHFPEWIYDIIYVGFPNK